jgi:hypothetical protein
MADYDTDTSSDTSAAPDRSKAMNDYFMRLVAQVAQLYGGQTPQGTIAGNPAGTPGIAPLPGGPQGAPPIFAAGGAIASSPYGASQSQPAPQQGPANQMAGMMRDPNVGVPNDPNRGFPYIDQGGGATPKPMQGMQTGPQSIPQMPRGQTGLAYAPQQQPPMPGGPTPLQGQVMGAQGGPQDLSSMPFSPEQRAFIQQRQAENAQTAQQQNQPLAYMDADRKQMVPSASEMQKINKMPAASRQRILDAYANRPLSPGEDILADPNYVSHAPGWYDPGLNDRRRGTTSIPGSANAPDWRGGYTPGRGGQPGSMGIQGARAQIPTQMRAEPNAGLYSPSMIPQGGGSQGVGPPVQSGMPTPPPPPRATTVAEAINEYKKLYPGYPDRMYQQNASRMMDQMDKNKAAEWNRQMQYYNAQMGGFKEMMTLQAAQQRQVATDKALQAKQQHWDAQLAQNQEKINNAKTKDEKEALMRERQNMIHLRGQDLSFLSNALSNPNLSEEGAGMATRARQGVQAIDEGLYPGSQGGEEEGQSPATGGPKADYSKYMPELPHPKTPEEASKLPSGTRFIIPDGPKKGHIGTAP